MTSFMRRLKYIVLAPIFIISTIVLQFANVPLAHAATRTWDGSAGDNKFSTAANWSSDTAPVNGDVITLPGSVLSVDGTKTLDNDISSLSLAGITVNGASTANAHYAISGNDLTLTGGITSTMTRVSGGSTVAAGFDVNVSIILGADVTIGNDVGFGGTSKTIDTQGHAFALAAAASSCVFLNKLLGSGAVSITGTSTSAISTANASTTFTGTLSVASGALYVNQTSAAGSGITVSGTGILSLYAASNSTWAAPLSLGGSGYMAVQHGSPNGCSGGGDASTYTGTFNGAVTLTSDFAYKSNDNMTVAGTYTTNGHSFAVANGYSGVLTTPEGTSQAPDTTSTYDGDASTTDQTVVNKDTATLNGTRQDISVNQGGTLKGTGTARVINNSGILAPGNSPGKLTVLTTFTQSSLGTFQMELLDTSTYDQLVVGAGFSGGGNAVNLQGNLQVILYDGWSVKTGDKFTIIDNQSSTAVNGQFAGLSEGGQFVVSNEGVNVTFSITYIGGDGNDVIITALNAGEDPTPPNTGAAKLLLGNPILLAGLGIVTAGLLTFIAIRRRATK